MHSYSRIILTSNDPIQRKEIMFSRTLLQIKEVDRNLDVWFNAWMNYKNENEKIRTLKQIISGDFGNKYGTKFLQEEFQCVFLHFRKQR